MSHYLGRFSFVQEYSHTWLYMCIVYMTSPITFVLYLCFLDFLVRLTAVYTQSPREFAFSRIAQSCISTTKHHTVHYYLYQ